jgi:hypothetical protein
MSRIDGIGAGAVTATNLGGVGETQRALTTKTEPTLSVDADIAPMLGGLLRRLDAFERPGPARAVPGPSGPEGPVPPGRALAAMTRASARLKGALDGAQDSAQTQRIQGMIDVLDEHLALKREVLVRAGPEA